MHCRKYLLCRVNSDEVDKTRNLQKRLAKLASDLNTLSRQGPCSPSQLTDYKRQFSTLEASRKELRIDSRS